MMQNITDTLKRLDITNIDLTRFDVTKIEWSKFDPRHLADEIGDFDLPEFDLPDFEVPAEVEKVADLMRDVAYAGIGATVLAAQKVDEGVRKLIDRAA